VEDSKKKGYSVTLIFFYLSSQDLAVKRVETRVKEGGHNIPEKVIRRRYENGLKNFFNIFRSIVDEWLFIENSGEPYKLIAQKTQSREKVYIDIIWNELKTKYDGQ
jgi:predicted ABC-type ATPase